MEDNGKGSALARRVDGALCGMICTLCRNCLSWLAGEGSHKASCGRHRLHGEQSSLLKDGDLRGCGREVAITTNGGEAGDRHRQSALEVLAPERDIARLTSRASGEQANAIAAT
jgi:hypothetical protein